MRPRSLLRRHGDRLLPPLLLAAAAAIVWFSLLPGGPAPAGRGPRATGEGGPVAAAVATPAQAVSLTASPRLALPGSRLAGEKRGFGVDLDRALAAAIPAASPPPRPASPAARPAPPPGLQPIALPVLPAPRALRPGRGGAPTLAIMIDDLGHDPAAGRRAIALPARLTLAFLPYGHALPELTAAAAARGHDVFLHLPMEPEGEDDPGPNAILTGLDRPELARRLAWAFGRIPAAVGVNNHMGSRATRDPDLMLAVLTEVARRGLAFVDSRTSPMSVADATAARLGLPHAARDVFLDNDPAPAAVRARLEEAERLARRHGTALAIGHPYPSTLQVLGEWLPEARARGVALVTARELMVARQGCAGVATAAAGASC